MCPEHIKASAWSGTITRLILQILRDHLVASGALYLVEKLLEQHCACE